MQEQKKRTKSRDIRLFVDVPLQDGQASPLDDAQVHYLTKVMRCQHGDMIKAFNGRDGEWRMQLEMISKKKALLLPVEKLRDQQASPDLWLAFAPVKKTGTELIIEKATELGVSRLLPILTERSQGERLRLDRLSTIMLEAAEQCERLDIPVLDEPVALDALLDAWPEGRPLWACLERKDAAPAPVSGPAGGIIIGPEGGFSAAEQEKLAALSYAVPISLGPRILRAETAALTATGLWLSLNGDWF